MENNLDNQETQDQPDQPLTREDVISIVQEYLQSSAFTDRKLTDYPTDDFAVVNRKYITANGTFASRPAGAVKGQPYFATDLSYPAWYDGANWVNGSGSVLGAGL